MKILALDAGGTSIKAALFSGGSQGELLCSPSFASYGGARFFKEICRVIDGYSSYERISLSVTGQVNPVDGSILYANSNVPFFTGMPLKQLLQERYQVPVTVENDVNAAALAEATVGAGQGSGDFLCLTYGTGIGGAFILNGGLYRGRHGGAGEVGRLITHADREEGFYEKYASAEALVQKAASVCPQVKDGKTFFSLLSRKKENLMPVLNLWIGEVAFGLVSLIYIFDSGCVVLGGGVMEEQGLVERIEKRCRELLPSDCRAAVIKPAMLGNGAGVYGAYLLAEKGV